MPERIDQGKPWILCQFWLSFCRYSASLDGNWRLAGLMGDTL